MMVIIVKIMTIIGATIIIMMVPDYKNEIKQTMSLHKTNGNEFFAVRPRKL